MKKSFLYEFYGIPQNGTIKLENGRELELGKIYTETGFGEVTEDVDDDWTDEYDVENSYDYEDFISFLKTKMKEKDAYNESVITEAEYQGHKVTLNKPMQGDVKKFKVYVMNPAGRVVKVNFGDPNMRIKKSNPDRRRSFRARHHCDSPGPRTKARYWSCRKW